MYLTCNLLNFKIPVSNASLSFPDSSLCLKWSLNFNKSSSFFEISSTCCFFCFTKSRTEDISLLMASIVKAIDPHYVMLLLLLLQLINLWRSSIGPYSASVNSSDSFVITVQFVCETGFKSLNHQPYQIKIHNFPISFNVNLLEQFS